MSCVSWYRSETKIESSTTSMPIGLSSSSATSVAVTSSGPSAVVTPSRK
ncbi:Uncharacterised protein [Mycobacteroides abscessus]|nr:Uncharacterised protein [Mycobacteroides abscessus]